MKHFSTFFSLLMLLFVGGANQIACAQTIGFYSPYEDIESDCDNANLYGSYRWFVDNYVGEGKEGVVVTPSTLSKIDDLTTLWVVYDEDNLRKGWNNLPEAISGTAALAAFKKHVQAGGSLYLTVLATQLPVALGRIGEEYAPNSYNTSVSKENYDIWGICPYIGLAEDNTYDHSSHPIYTLGKLYSAKYTDTQNPANDHTYYPLINAYKKADHNCIWDVSTMDGLEANPNKMVDFETKTTSVVLGTWQQVLDYTVAAVVEFKPTAEFKGTMLCNGIAAYDFSLYPDKPSMNDYMVNMYTLTKNSLSYLTSIGNKGGATGITQINEEKGQLADEAYYTLTGMKVAHPSAGIYIHNGKKVVVK